MRVFEVAQISLGGTYLAQNPHPQPFSPRKNHSGRREKIDLCNNALVGEVDAKRRVRVLMVCVYLLIKRIISRLSPSSPTLLPSQKSLREKGEHACLYKKWGDTTLYLLPRRNLFQHETRAVQHHTCQ